jgi:hypothetical protein
VAYKNATQDCLNGLAPKVQSFMNGDISEEEWQRVWTCTLGALDTFQRFVDGSDPRGYTQADLKALVGQFLVTDREVSDSLIQALMELKASVAGGDVQLVTYGEINFLKTLLTRFQEESGPLIPLLKARKQNPTPEGVIQLADAIGVMADRLASVIENPANRDFSRESAEVLVRELERMNLLRIPSDTIGLGFAGKRLFFSGASNAIEGGTWAEFVRTGARVGGLMVAVKSLDSTIDKLDFRNEVAKRVYALLVEAIDRHGGLLGICRRDGDTRVGTAVASCRARCAASASSRACSSSAAARRWKTAAAST